MYTFLGGQTRSNAPHTPRIVLLGPTGSGKGVQASLLANKYNIVNGENLDFKSHVNAFHHHCLENILVIFTLLMYMYDSRGLYQIIIES